MATAGVDHLIAAHRPARLHAVDAVEGQFLDVVTERQVAVGPCRDAFEPPHPLQHPNRAQCGDPPGIQQGASALMALI